MEKKLDHEKAEKRSLGDSQAFDPVQNECNSRKLFHFIKYRPWNIKKDAYFQWKNSYIILV